MILVVDDHRDTVEFLCRLLRRCGYETACAVNGVEAMNVLAEATPSLVILDVQMPLMTGLEVLAAMNPDERLRRIPVLMYSAGHEREQQERAIQLGAKAYLVKGAVGMPEMMALVAQHAGPGKCAATG